MFLIVPVLPHQRKALLRLLRKRTEEDSHKNGKEGKSYHYTFKKDTFEGKEEEENNSTYSVRKCHGNG